MKSLHDISQHKHEPEQQCVEKLLSLGELSQEQKKELLDNATTIVEECRSRRDDAGTLEAFLLEFGLSNNEGVALMCLAESLLRIPDTDNIDKLIAEKISTGDWAAHKGQSPSVFVNASVWGLMLTGEVISDENNTEYESNQWLGKLVNRVSEPIVRKAMLQAMRIMGKQYVLGRNINEAIQRSKKYQQSHTRFSFDMLGEGARTHKDAERYYQSYRSAILAIAESAESESIHNANSISIKLSALHPRYEPSKLNMVMSDLYEKILSLASLAKEHNLAISIDAEEASRLELNLMLFEKLAHAKELENWEGLGFVLQAYQKRAIVVCDWLIELAKSSKKKITVRLVKGAYWDTEIKHAQESGFADYPVFTRKANTDLSYRACAKKLLAEQTHIYPQFATHNAQTIALINSLGKNCDYEFQRLHGMGELLYKVLDEQGALPKMRIYAPVGEHQDLLPYLVRRLLENGANSSFVNRFLDDATPINKLIKDTETEVLASKSLRNEHIPLPEGLFTSQLDYRSNSKGLDIEEQQQLLALEAVCKNNQDAFIKSRPIINGQKPSGSTQPLFSPAQANRAYGDVLNASAEDATNALNAASAAQQQWDASGADHRAEILNRTADLLQEHQHDLIALLAQEAGRTLNDGISEVREAIDFCRYYAHQAQNHFGEPATLPGPTGESNELFLQGRGVFLCISPWNFPLAIFAGQIAAALAAGNCVLAKPAEQTPAIAMRAIELFHQAGVPHRVLHFLPGDGATIGNALIAQPELGGVMFTGSTETASIINKNLASREGPIIPFIAETGGINVMLADSTALPEQLIDDVIDSAFNSAGQRCSALRVLYIQDEIADNVIEMLSGAMQTLQLGDPALATTDIGPVIDEEALRALESHRNKMDKNATLLAGSTDTPTTGSFFPPCAYEIASLSELPNEVFGPILHIIRYQSDQLDAVIKDINNSRYGLTLGVHSRIKSFADYIFDNTTVGNVYINRNIVGAVVGVNPFGGNGLSGTGPKAGGPHYLTRLGIERTRTTNEVATGGNIKLFTSASN